MVSQCISCLTGTFYLFTQNMGYWKWFSIYLIIIFFQEFFWFTNEDIDTLYRTAYYAFFGVPLQYGFFYWLYALKSLRRKRLFFFMLFIFFGTLTISFLFKGIDEGFSLASNIGTLMLMVLIVLEFIKQIKSDKILKFTENRMFYINTALILFYIGNYPFHILGPELYENYQELWRVYYIYFLATNSIMYLLFTASFIWGKTRS